MKSLPPLLTLRHNLGSFWMMIQSNYNGQHTHEHILMNPPWLRSQFFSGWIISDDYLIFADLSMLSCIYWFLILTSLWNCSTLS